MLFNANQFIFIFLPLVFAVFQLLSWRGKLTGSKVWLVLTSLFFYGYWDPRYLLLILASMLVNYAVGHHLNAIDDRQARKSRGLVSLGVGFNLALLGYFKYMDFFIDNFNWAFSADMPLQNVVLPLAISFFTFQQIAYLIDTHKRECKEYDFLSYALFVCFFPQLIAGPIVHHKEMMPQFNRVGQQGIQWHNISLGLFIFTIGLVKKVVIADTLAISANLGYSQTELLTFWDSWATSLSYTFQLYFDFSGYADMAIGAALLFNIRLPINFNSPYKAVDIQDFWRRWHMTLSRWFREYVYIPLGGNRFGKLLTLRNVFLTAFVSGIWHGAGWTFVLWGAAHGLAMVVNRLWRDLGFKMRRGLAWFTTFMFVNATWVLFRAETLADAKAVLTAMLGQRGGFALSRPLADALAYLLPVLPKLPKSAVSNQSLVLDIGLIWLLLAALLISVWGKNVSDMTDFLNAEKPDVSLTRAFSAGALFFVATIYGFWQPYSEFIYFNF